MSDDGFLADEAEEDIQEESEGEELKSDESTSGDEMPSELPPRVAAYIRDIKKVMSVIDDQLPPEFSVTAYVDRIQLGWLFVNSVRCSWTTRNSITHLGRLQSMENLESHARFWIDSFENEAFAFIVEAALDSAPIGEINRLVRVMTLHARPFDDEFVGPREAPPTPSRRQRRKQHKRDRATHATGGDRLPHTRAMGSDLDA
jgi:hypothetical protein